MKYSRTQLKALIKECLTEILLEGLGENLSEAKLSKQKLVHKQQRPTHLDSQRVVPPLQDAVKKSSNGNPILAEILADTAATTLQAQMSADKNGPVIASDAFSMKVAQSSPEELFGEDVSSKWADLAFAKKP